MTALNDLDVVIEQSHLAWGEFVKGNPEPAKKLFSHQNDATVANPFGPVRVDGSRSPRQWSVPHRCTETARSSALRT
jgi:hypothetical protein